MFIQDIMEAINDIEKFVDGLDFDAFCSDNKTKSAAVWKIETIGFAAKNIPAEIKNKYKQLPWKQMAGTRDKIAHFYFGIDYKIVWKIIKEELPQIKPIIKTMLDEIDIDE
jgi:uncharacterized protein with HEPN domain